MGRGRRGGGLITRHKPRNFSNALVIIIKLGTILVRHPSNIFKNEKVLTHLFLMISSFFATGRDQVVL